MGNRRVLLTITFLVVCAIAYGLTLLLLESAELALMVFGGLLGFAVVFTEPFIGLLNYLFFLYVRPQEYVAGMMGMPIMLMLGGLTLGLMFLHMAVKKRKISLTRTPQNWLMLWFIAAIAVSHLSHGYIVSTFEVIKKFLPAAVMYFLITNLVTTPRKLKLVVLLLVGLTLTLAVSGIVQNFTGVGIGGQEAFGGERVQGVGIFSDPNDLALALVIVIPFAFLKLFGRSDLWEKLLAFIAFAVLAFALFLTASRGGLLAFSGLMMILMTRRFGIAMGAIAGVCVLAAIVVLGPRMATISTGEASAYGRIEAWALGLDLFEAYPLFGVGKGRYLHFHFRTAHNSFVLCAAELGMFGLYPWVMMIYLSIRNNHHIGRAIRATRLDDITIYVDTVRYGLIAFAMAAYFLSRTYNDLLFILIGLSAAVTHIFVSASEDDYRLIERKDFVYGLLCVIGGWLLTKMFLYTAW